MRVYVNPKSTAWANLPVMRWDKLFADLEAETHESQLVERDALIDDLRDGEWASTPWSALCGGDVILVVAGARVAGHVLSVNRQIIHLRAEQNDIIVNPDWVDEISASTRRSTPASTVSARLGWPHIFRACRRDRDRIQLRRRDGANCSGTVDRVGQDFVSIREDAPRSVVVPFTAIATLTCPR